MNPRPPILSVRRVSKAFGPVQALDQVNLDLRPGKVHALVGENGAGKSTLSKVLSGLVQADVGTMQLDSRTYAPGNRREASSKGVRMVMQELNLIHTLNVAEALCFEKLPNRWGWIDRSTLRSRAANALAGVGLTDLDPDTPIGSLGVGHQQLVEIAAGLSRQCKVLILDEPTAALTEPEIDHLFDRIAELKACGVAILYISHRMEELMRIADTISVLRDGRLRMTRCSRKVSMDEIVRAMVGRDLEAVSKAPLRQPGGVVLRVRNLAALPRVQEVSFDLREGEILGLAGLMGSGRTEAVRALFGADSRTGGTISLGHPLRPVDLRSPRQAVRHGIALLTEDRKEQGLLLPLSVRFNSTLPSLTHLQRRGGWISAKTESAAAHRWIRTLGVRCRNDLQPVRELSGGNQQKTILARWLLRDSKILILDEPTRGIDVGGKAEIYRLLEQLAADGKALLMVSSDLPELIRIADRIAVMSAGVLVRTFVRGTWSEDAIMNAALSRL